MMKITIPKNPIKLRTQCIPYMILFDSFHIMFVVFCFCNFMYNLINYILPFSLWSASCFFFDTHSLGFGSKFFITTKRGSLCTKLFLCTIILHITISCFFAICWCGRCSFYIRCTIILTRSKCFFGWRKGFLSFCTMKSFFGIKTFGWAIFVKSTTTCGSTMLDIDDKSCFGIDSHLCGNPHQCLVKVCFVEIERIWHKDEKKEMIKNLLSVWFVYV